MKRTNLLKIWSLTLFLTLCISLYHGILYAQAPIPTFTGGELFEFPAKLQLYARDKATNKANVPVSGRIADSQPYTSVRLKVFRDANRNGIFSNAEIVDSRDAALSTPSGGYKTFSFTPYPLPAELYNYQFRFIGINSSGIETQLATTDSVVAGDVYIIHGQSNAEAFNNCESGLYPCNPNSDGETFVSGGNPIVGLERSFVRVYGNGNGAGWYNSTNLQESYSLMPKSWGIGSGLVGRKHEGFRHTGQWGMYLARLIAQNHGIPVSIFNEAYGAEIRHFQKNSNRLDPTGRNNYACLLSRTQEAGLQNKITAIFWFQGEGNMTNADGQQLDKDGYKAEFNILYNNWKLDYPSFTKLYVFQVKRGCFEGYPDYNPTLTPDLALNIMQAQREIVAERPEAVLISSTNITQAQDFGSTGYCHYVFSGGYESVGQRAYNQVKRHFYNTGLTEKNLDSPEPDKADYSFDVPNRIVISLKNQTDTYTLNGTGIQNDFRLEGGGYTITSVQLSGSFININYTMNAGTIVLPTAVSYFGHQGTANPSITNASGTGLITFRSLPIVSGSLPVDPLSLVVSRDGGSNKLRWKVETNDEFESFIIERGETRTSFIGLKEMYSTGESGIVSYSFTDIKPNARLSHYRIRAIRSNGKEIFSQIVTINNKLSEITDFRVYPNPVANAANATVTMKSSAMSTIQILDASGRILSNRKMQLQKGNNQFAMDELADLRSGTYIVRIICPTEIQQLRVVKSY